MDEPTALIVTGLIVVLIGLVFCINEVIRPFGFLVILAGVLVVLVGLIFTSIK